MPKYDAKSIEKEFKSAASLRIARKKRGNKDYANDASYWEGGRCNWGGSHNLSEDCQEIARGFVKIDDLKSVETELNQCTSEQEFNATKSRLIRQAQELESSLQTKTGPASSMFGICIIWSEYTNFIESRLRVLRSEISRLKDNINSQQYKYIEELKSLKLEQKQIENRMKENKRKAQSEKDPAKKALLLQLIEEDGERLEENLKKQKAIPTVNLRFEPDKYVSDLIESMKKAIEKGGGDDGGDGGGSGGRNKNRGDGDDNGDDGWTKPSDPNKDNSGSRRRNNRQPQNFFQDNPQLLLVIGTALLLAFYFYSQSSKTQEKNYYDF